MYRWRCVVLFFVASLIVYLWSLFASPVPCCHPWQVAINCNVTHLCRYKKKSDDFHKFTDENGTVFGFGFYKKDESLREAEKYCFVLFSLVFFFPSISFLSFLAFVSAPFVFCCTFDTRKLQQNDSLCAQVYASRAGYHPQR